MLSNASKQHFLIAFWFLNYILTWQDVGKLFNVDKHVWFAIREKLMFFQAFKDSNSEQLESLHIPSLFLCNVREMEVDDCPQLKSVLSLSNGITMQLEDLDIRGCDGLKNIVTVSGDDDDANYSSILPKLRRIYVNDCKQLEYISTKVPLHMTFLVYFHVGM